MPCIINFHKYQIIHTFILPNNLSINHPILIRFNIESLFPLPLKILFKLCTLIAFVHISPPIQLHIKSLSPLYTRTLISYSNKYSICGLRSTSISLYNFWCTLVLHSFHFLPSVLRISTTFFYSKNFLTSEKS